MKKCLYLLCPTDCLESIINNTFKQENYFYTSLGNSVMFDDNTLNQIKELVQKHNFKEISFVMSDKNNIITDALENQVFLKTRGLNSLYHEIIKQKKHSEIFIDYNQFSILSYYLNNKIKELQFGLRNVMNHPIKINGKIYNRSDKTFKSIYSDLVCIEKHSLN